jgi:hypothetical protein
MVNDSLLPMSRRGLLGLGILAGMLGTSSGCGEEGAVKKIDTPPSAAGTGNRNRLQQLQKNAENLQASKKKG